MSGKIPDLKKLRSMIKESEERIRIVDSPKKSISTTPVKEVRNQKIDTELLDVLGTKSRETVNNNYDKQFLGKIKQEMEELDKELGRHFEHNEEEDDLCISSESEKDKFVSSSPFQLTLQSQYSENSTQEKETINHTNLNKLSINSKENPNSFKIRLQGAMATIKSLELKLKEKDSKIQELETELKKKSKSLESFQSLSSTNPTPNKGEGSFKNKLRKKEKEFES